MAITTPFTATVSANYPPDDGKAAADRDNAVSGTYTQKVEHDLVLTGSGTHVVGFGSIASIGAKLVQIEVDPVAAGGSAAPINVQFNGGGAPGQVEVAQGGHLQVASPAPSAGGILSMSIVHTQNACVKVRLLA